MALRGRLAGGITRQHDSPTRRAGAADDRNGPRAPKRLVQRRTQVGDERRSRRSAAIGEAPAAPVDQRIRWECEPASARSMSVLPPTRQLEKSATRRGPRAASPCVMPGPDRDADATTQPSRDGYVMPAISTRPHPGGQAASTRLRRRWPLAPTRRAALPTGTTANSVEEPASRQVGTRDGGWPQDLERGRSPQRVGSRAGQRRTSFGGVPRGRGADPSRHP